MTPIKFGTDGWRAIIADDFTIANLRRVALATAQWLKAQRDLPDKIVVGYDCRFNGRLFAETTARVFAREGIEVVLSKGFVSTPMVSLATQRLQAGCGVINTASHNPPAYSGYKIKGAYGGPALPEMIAEVEALVPDEDMGSLPELDLMLQQGVIRYEDIEDMYIRHAEQQFDIVAIRNSSLKIAYDAMFGAGQKAVKQLLPEAVALHAEFNPSFMGTAPEPIMKNLVEFEQMIKDAGDIDFAFATDGDADRIGILDGKGQFIDSHHIILMLINYLAGQKKMTGKVVHSFSCTSKITDLAKKHNVEPVTTKIGFKYICGHMVEEDVLIGGEESGGIAVKGHIPERDGVWIALTILEYMATSGKSLDELRQEIYNQVGEFAMERLDLHITEDLKQTVLREAAGYKEFGTYKVQSLEDLDGFKYHLSKDSWVMIRPSGTEPVLRVYAEAPSYDEATNILEQTKEAINA